MNRSGRLPLEGVKVVDLSWVVAAPTATLLLALQGADVVKIEPVDRVDFAKIAQNPVPSDPDMGPVFATVNMCKRAVSLDLKQEEGAALARRLALGADIVVESMRPGKIAALGLGYDRLRMERPDLVMASFSGFGQFGPEAQYGSYASTFGALSGISHMTGYADGTPVQLRASADVRGGMALLTPLLAALWRARSTGQGSYIDVSSVEASSSVLGAEVLDVQMNDRDPSRRGNDQPKMAPHGVYACAGDESYIVIACRNQHDWGQLCEALEGLDPAESRFSAEEDRWINRAELDGEMRDLLRTKDREPLIAELQARGVPAGPSLSNKDIFEDPTTHERGVWTNTKHAKQGDRWVVGAPWVSSRTGRGREPTASPLTAEHTAEVLRDELDLSDAEIDDLAARGVIKVAEGR